MNKKKSQNVKIITILGARPQFIKAAPLSQAFALYPEFTEIILHTGQHFDREMSEIFFKELKIPKPNYNLNIHGGSHADMTGKMLQGIEDVLLYEKPDLVLVYGDTNSTLAGGLAAVKLHVPVCHVESGLRSFNKKMPEEINRVVTDHLSSILLCPTSASVNNLKREGITNGIYWVGDLMYDACLQFSPIAKKKSNILSRISLQEKSYVLATVHRAENTNSREGLQKIINFICTEAESADLEAVLPLHPRTKQLSEHWGIDFKNVILCEPLGYLDMHCLLQGARLILTDSGGMQKEAYFHRVPCVTLRDETEWVETIQFGWNRLWNTPNYTQSRSEIDEYGEGKSASIIAETLYNWFKKA